MTAASRAVPAKIVAAMLAALAAMSSYEQTPSLEPTSAIVQNVSATTSPAPATTPPAETAPEPQALELLELVNTERSKAGCSAVSLEPRLNSAALLHSQDMIKRNYFEHDTPDGVSPGERVHAAGYDWSSTGENIAAGYHTPRDVMGGWMKSPGHRENILDCDWIHMGVGIVENEAGKIYWTQEFGVPKNRSSHHE
ncbi:MAG: CAP domain-containing protein [Mycobacteriales bacterium]